MAILLLVVLSDPVADIVPMREREDTCKIFRHTWKSRVYQVCMAFVSNYYEHELIPKMNVLKALPTLQYALRVRNKWVI
jgi:hypothetical protein